MIDVSFSSLSVSIRLVQLLQYGINFCCFPLPGGFLLELPGALHFNLAMDAGSSVELIIKAFRWKFGHGDGIFL